jgi:hypothetical protein
MANKLLSVSAVALAAVLAASPAPAGDPRPVSVIVAGDRFLVPMLDSLRQTYQQRCTYEHERQNPDNPTVAGDDCTVATFIGNIDRRALLTAINGGIDQHAKNCLYFAVEGADPVETCAAHLQQPALATSPAALAYAQALLVWWFQHG